MVLLLHVGDDVEDGVDVAGGGGHGEAAGGAFTYIYAVSNKRKNKS